MQMACVVLQKDGKNWFAEVAVDMDKIQEITRTILALYDLYKSYEEKKEIQSLLAKMPKPKTQPSRYMIQRIPQVPQQTCKNAQKL